MTGSGTSPTFLLIGAARSGTTGLAEGLRTHGRVFLTQPKEPHYFALHGSRPTFTGPGDERFVNDAAVTDWAAYAALFAKAGKVHVRGDASVSTLYYHRRAIPEIAERIEDPRLLVILREPADRAFSAFEYQRGIGLETAATFSEALAAEPERIAQGWQHLWHYAGMSHYAESISSFYDAFGRDRVRVLYHDDLEQDFAATVTSALDFIGAEITTPPDRPIRVNAGGSSRSPGLSRALDIARGVEPLRRAVRAVTPYRLREKARQAMLQHDELGADDRSALNGVFRDDLRELAALLPAAGQPAWVRAHS